MVRSWPATGICCDFRKPPFALHVVSTKDSFSARCRMSTVGQKRPFGTAPESGRSYPFPAPENCPQMSVILELLYGQAEFQVTVKFE